MKQLLITIAALVLAGCASTNSLHVHTVSIGMAEHEITSLRGEPSSRFSQDGFVYFVYSKELSNGLMIFESYIRFKEGKVDAFGKFEDLMELIK